MEDYILAQLNIPEKPDGDWYAYYSIRNPKTGEMIQKKKRKGINRKKSVKEKKEFGRELVNAINDLLKSGRLGMAKKSNDFYWWFKNYMAKLKGVKSEAHYLGFQAVLNKMQDFRPELSIIDFDDVFISDFHRYLIKKGNNPNTISDTMMRIRMVTKPIIKAGVLPYHENPMLDVKFKKVKTSKIRLNEKQIKIFVTGKANNRQEDMARDIYLTSFYNAGMRFGDVIRLEDKMIGERLNYTMNKNNALKSFKIHPIIRAIFEKRKGNGKYIFNTGFDPKSAHASIKNINNVLSMHLKRFCKNNGLPEVTFHTARHSFANVARVKLKDLRATQGLLSHSDSKTTEIYLGEMEIEEVDKAMDTIYK